MRSILDWLIAASVATLLEVGPASADGRSSKIDTEHLFGFTAGTDVGEVGEKELENTTVSRLGKIAGSYAALSHTLALEYVPLENLRIELGAIADYHAISGVSGFDSLHQASFQGASFELRYRLLKRDHASFGLALLAEPHWSRIDEASGQPANQYGTELAVLMDKEFIANRLVGALNLFYAPEVTARGAEISRESTLGVGAGVMAQVWPGVLLGVEARYLRAYQGLGLNGFAGHALFLGPNLSFESGGKWRVTMTWAAQVAGHAMNDPGALDLTNFERHQIRLRIGYDLN
jgi:hypothetical protein